jgi:CBS domain-containing protein
MTKDPIAQTPDITVAFALNLMSQGGFRHLPLVDERNIPVGILSVKDMMDFIVGSFVEGLLNFDIEVPESLV